MKKMLIIIISALGGLLVIGLIFMSYSGLFSHVEVKETNNGPYKFIYKENIGEYRKLRPLFLEIEKLKKSNSDLATAEIAGVYFDNPKKVPGDQLRSEVGLIVASEIYTKKQNDKDFSGYKFRTITKRDYFAADFPYINDYSIILAIFRVYPVINEYAINWGKQRDLDVEKLTEETDKSNYALEIYRKEKIHIMMSIPILNNIE